MLLTGWWVSKYNTKRCCKFPVLSLRFIMVLWDYPFIPGKGRQKISLQGWSQGDHNCMWAPLITVLLWCCLSLVSVDGTTCLPPEESERKKLNPFLLGYQWCCHFCYWVDLHWGCAVPSAFRCPLISSTENFILWKDMVVTSHLSLKTVLFYPPEQQWPLWQFLASRSFCAGALAVIHWKENWLFAQILQVSRDPGYWRIGENCSKVSTLNLFCVSFPRAFPTTSKTGVLLHEWHSASKAPGQIPLGPADLFPWQWCGFLCVQCGSETVTKH